MPDTMTRPSTTIDTLVEQDVEMGKSAHIVKTEPGKTAAATVLEARVFGTEIEAMCGERFVPSRDPARYPLCDACKEIMDLHKMVNKDLHDAKA